MKRVSLATILIMSVWNVHAQYINVSDSNFRNKLMSIYPSCFNSQKKLDTTCSTIVNEDTLNIANSNIGDIKEIKYFKNLQVLDCSNNNLTSIPTLPSNLKDFSCFFNNVTTIDSLPLNLINLTCSNNLLTNLPPLPATLIKLWCDNNKLTNLPTLPTNIQDLVCSNNLITSLPSILPNTIYRLRCSGNLLTSIPSLPINLNELICGGNLFTQLPFLPNSISVLWCENGSLTSFPNLPYFLIKLVCYRNKITTLPELPYSLQQIRCSINPLVSLPSLPSSLQELECDSTLISKVPTLPNNLNYLKCSRTPNLHCLPVLPYSLTSLSIDTLQIPCLPNFPRTILLGSVYRKSYPICNAVNNPYSCNSYPIIQGYIFTDPNSNSIKDTLEPYKSNVKVQLSNGNYTFTDNNGFYQIQADSIGAYTLTVTAPNLYNAVPQTINYNFSSWDTVVTKDIALQPTIVKDSVAINVIPMVMNAVQGAAMPYWVQYMNAGTTVLSPTVNLTYNNYLLGYDSCTDVNAAPTSNGIVAGELNMQPGKQNNLISYFTIKPSANIGDTLSTVYNISTTTISQTDSFYMIVEGGVAKSDAQRATPSLTDAQVAAGKEIVYTIGFKNTGNDTAYNVVIADTLSSLLKANTLQMVASSHTCKATVKGNVATFELLNIKLPKASSNPLKSVGFVSFKIKPKTTLVAGNIITNKANTYYNYRTPQSSIATTIIKAVVTPLTMLDVTCWMLDVKNVAVNWTTANEVDVRHFNIQRSINKKDFINVGKVLANNKSSNEYGFIDDIRSVELGIRNLYYRIESVDKDGRKQYSEIRNVTLGNRDGGLSVYPNPAKDVVTVE